MIYFVALMLVAAILAPIAYIILGGFRSNSAITVDPSGLPTSLRGENYLNVLTSGTFWQEIGNSTFAAVGTSFLSSSLASWPHTCWHGIGSGDGECCTRSSPRA